MSGPLQDIRKDLMERMAVLQDQMRNLGEERNKLDAELRDLEQKLMALRIILDLEQGRLGEARLPLFAREGRPSKWAGLTLTQAISALKKEAPGLTKEQARDILVKGGFDFKGKRPGSAVHFAWINLERRSRAAR